MGGPVFKPGDRVRVVMRSKIEWEHNGSYTNNYSNSKIYHVATYGPQNNDHYVRMTTEEFPTSYIHPAHFELVKPNNMSDTNNSYGPVDLMAGDIVTIDSAGELDWEVEDYVTKNELEIGAQYEVAEVQDERREDVHTLSIRLRGYEDKYWISAGHVTKIDLANIGKTTIFPTGSKEDSPIERKLFGLQDTADMVNVMNPNQIVYKQEDIIQLLYDIRNGKVRL